MSEGWVPWDPSFWTFVVEALSTLMILWVLKCLTNARRRGSQFPTGLLIFAAASGAWSWVVIAGTSVVLGTALAKESR